MQSQVGQLLRPIRIEFSAEGFQNFGYIGLAKDSPRHWSMLLPSKYVVKDRKGEDSHTVKLGKTKAALPPSQLSSRSTPPQVHTPDVTTGYRNVWVCDSCTLENAEESGSRCSACGSFKPNNRRSKLSLAQKKGLVQAPPPKLSQNQWEDCEAKAEERGDTMHPCSICRESFGVQPKVILSCSHMFHHNCLASFERFLRTNQRVCPLCRKQNYQKRHTNQGESGYRIQYEKECPICINAIEYVHLYYAS
ncbi:hypothetical protein DYB26_004259 [Aphanomyces astaci]|uniref:RING-type domain-containing protein n=1 Tax=Aphanomyces astaci TaxID=112090 RepID=A0A3R7CBD8_APHAT|nr:hypothetical protein DYB34_007474 [Aphanomyces astaci]RHZ42719.1 hypothetical protein DYB26_004259 [Aphanomyces astaci]